MQPLLMIIDMQQGMSWPQAGRRNNPNAEHDIAALLNHWRQQQAPILHVCHHSRDPNSLFWPEQEGVLFQSALAPLENEKVIKKSVPDAFAHSGLEQWLHEQAITDLVVVGVSTNNSVEASARSAGNLGFNAYVVANACFTFDKMDFNGVLRSAEEVHAMSLANLQGEYAEVIRQEQAIKHLATTIP